VGEHDLVEGALHVQHHGVQFAAGTVAGVELDLAGAVVQSGQAQRLGQPPGRVDGQHDGAAAVQFGRPQRQRRRRGGLPDPARTAADHDAYPWIGEDGVHVEPGGLVLTCRQVSSWGRPGRPCGVMRA
jgi:hypothetical protein